MERRLAAILAADAVGYSKLMGLDEEAALATLAERRSIIDQLIASHGGRIFGTAGDSVVAEFASSVEATRCALAIQDQLREVNAGIPDDARMAFRIGVNFGDVMIEGGDVLGDGVNVAARLEGLAPSGGICISAQVGEQLSGELRASFSRAGSHNLKNIDNPVGIWCWPPEHAGAMRRRTFRSKRNLVLGALMIAAVAAVSFVLVTDTPRTGVPSGPRIAVIPFDNVGNNAEDAYFSDGLTKDINAHLSKFSNLFVIAPSSVRDFRDKVDCGKLRSDLEVDFILEGTVRRSSDQLRVTTTFTDAKTCRQLDSPGPFDRDLSANSILDVQLEIATKVVAAVGSADAPLFNTRVQAEIRRKAPDSLQAYDCVLLSYWFYETFAPDRHRRARSCLERVAEIDPSFSLGWSRLAFSFIETKKYAIDTPADWAERARSAANRAIDLDPDNPDAYYALAILSRMTGANVAEFKSFAMKAIDLNPNDAFVLADLGTWMGYSGEWALGKEWVTSAKLLNPKHQSWLDYIWHLEHYLNSEYEQARNVALKINLPGNYMVQASLTAAYAMNGEQEKAKKALAHLLQIRPDYTKDPRAPFRTRGMPTELIESLMTGLRKAGLDVPR